MHDRVVAIIPARMGSSRFPGKPLAPLLGRPMIEYVLKSAEMCTQLSAVYVATCDEEIKNVVERLGGRVIMTSPAHERAKRSSCRGRRASRGRHRRDDPGRRADDYSGDDRSICNSTTRRSIRRVRKFDPSHYKPAGLPGCKYHQSRDERKR